MPAPTISASRLIKATCERKYVGHYLFGLREEQGPGALFGTEFHSAAEHYQLTGEVNAPESTIGRLLRGGLHLLRKPGSGALIEAEHRGLLPDGTEWVAYLDASDPAPTYGILKVESFQVDDQKTTSEASRALTDATLKTDLQSMFYGWIPFQPHQYRLNEESPWLEWTPPAELRNVALFWNYFLTRGSPRAWQARAFVDRAQTDAFMAERIMPIVERIKGLHAAFDAGVLTELNHADLNLDACQGVGVWCGAANKCEFSQPGLIQLRKKDTNMGLKELREKAKSAGATAPAENPAPAAAEPEAPTVVQSSVGALAKLRAKYGQAPTPAALNPKPEEQPSAPAAAAEELPKAVAAASEPSKSESSSAPTTDVTGAESVAPPPAARARRPRPQVAPPAEPPSPEGDRINPPEALNALAEIRSEVAAANAANDGASAAPDLLDFAAKVRAALQAIDVPAKVGLNFCCDHGDNRVWITIKESA